MEPLYIILIIVAILIIWIIAAYNGLIRLVNRTAEAWADIDVQLKRRYDLIPNLVDTVKGYASHEKEVFQKVTEARSQAISSEQSGDPKQVAASENMLTDALKSVFAVAEAYPDLKANENFLELQRELSDTENKIQAARRFYNTNVRDLNIKVETFPSNLIAKLFSFDQRDFFELQEEDARQPVDVKF